MKYFLYTTCLVFLTACGNSSENNAAEKHVATIDSLKQEITLLRQANDTLSDHLMKKSVVTQNYPSYFDSIPEPEKFILEKLQQDPGLIPKDGVLGGKMRFVRVSFIDEDLLVAEYEDGHIMGRSVYTYTMTRTGELSFSKVAEIE